MGCEKTKGVMGEKGKRQGIQEIMSDDRYITEF
jgi:hypothetical protein